MWCYPAFSLTSIAQKRQLDELLNQPQDLNSGNKGVRVIIGVKPRN